MELQFCAALFCRNMNYRGGAFYCQLSRGDIIAMIGANQWKKLRRRGVYLMDASMKMRALIDGGTFAPQFCAGRDSKEDSVYWY